MGILAGVANSIQNWSWHNRIDILDDALLRPVTITGLASLANRVHSTIQ
jgi:hypothetical protein